MILLGIQIPAPRPAQILGSFTPHPEVNTEGSEARRRYIFSTFGLNPFRGRYFLSQERKYPKKLPAFQSIEGRDPRPASTDSSAG
ncbi:MAG: hypothetical protein QG626_642 [Patescibacteria group bacterium]|nr:hypothetical protein [Patescibacteria group bacterium]